VCVVTGVGDEELGRKVVGCVNNEVILLDKLNGVQQVKPLVVFPYNDAVVWRICLWRLLNSTRSLSTSPIVPIPAAARYIAAGEPKPPAPIMSTWEACNFFCPFSPISGSEICLA
jgi:hypothetical protein